MKHSSVGYIAVAGVGAAPMEELPNQLVVLEDSTAVAEREAADQALLQSLFAWMQPLEQALEAKEGSTEKAKAMGSLLQALEELRVADRHSRGVVLRGAIALAILFREKAHLDLVGRDNEALFADSQEFMHWLAQRIGIGESRSRLSRLRRAGELWLFLHELKLPVPAAPERLMPLLTLPLQTAVEIYAGLVRQAQGKTPDSQAITDEVESRKEQLADKSSAARVETTAGATEPDWRQKALQLVRDLRRQVEARGRDARVRTAAEALVTHLSEKYELAGSRIARKRQRVRLVQLVQEQGGLELTIDQRTGGLHVSLNQIRDDRLRGELQKRAGKAGWIVDEDGNLYCALPAGRSERLARTAGQQKWLHELSRQLSPKKTEAEKT
jgi:hypothetical protein